MKVYVVYVVIVFIMFKLIKKNILFRNKILFKNINSICCMYLNEFCYFMNWYLVIVKYCVLKKFKECIYVYLYVEKIDWN